MPEYIIELRGDDGKSWMRLEPKVTYHCSVTAYARARMYAAERIKINGMSLDAMMARLRIRDIAPPLSDLAEEPCPDFVPSAMHPEFMLKMDWKLLRAQKRTLVALTAEGRGLTPKEADHLEGLLNGLDAIQDYAVDVMGIADATVFGPRDEDGYHIEEEDA